MQKTIAVGLIGYEFMGRAHSSAYRQVAAFFPDLGVHPVMATLCGRDGHAVYQAAQQLGWQEAVTDWRELVERPEIGLIDIATPVSNHAEIALAAAAQGKHIFCEKPLASTTDEARQMLEAVRRAGVVGMVNFNYRRVPAIALARRLIEEGQLGQIYHWRASYLQDWLVDPHVPLGWRLHKAEAGTGALGELGAHIIDLAHFLIGRIATVSAVSTTFVHHRPLAAGSEQMGPVTVDDAALCQVRFENGALGSFEMSRFATGHRNSNRIEINGSKGSLSFDLERLNELNVFLASDPPSIQGFRTILVTEQVHPYLKAWWPAGHVLGWEHTFIHTIYDLLQGIASGGTPAATFEDGMHCQAVVEAMALSSEQGQWVEPDYH